MSEERRWPLISALGVIEILARGASFCLPAVLAGPGLIVQDLAPPASSFALTYPGPDVLSH